MRLSLVLVALVLHCAASKSWNNDGYSEDTFYVFSWIGHLKRLSLIALMLSGVVLYYVPESRPHARRICHALIDLTANGLKSALSARESEYMYERIKSKYHRTRYEQMVAQKRATRETQEGNEDFEQAHRCYGKRARSFVDNDGFPGSREKRRINAKQSKESRACRQRLRSSTINDISGEPCVEVAKPVYLNSDKLEDLQKYVKTNFHGVKRPSVAAVENYALLISGSPRQMAMLDEKYEKDDVVIVQEPYVRVEYKECGTSTDMLSTKTETLTSEQEGPTRDHSDHVTESGIETYVKDVELSSIPEGDGSRYSVSKSTYQRSDYRCGGECCGDNGCSISSGDLNNNREAVSSLCSADIKNVLKSSRSMMSPKPLKRAEDHKNSRLSNCANYNQEGIRCIKSNCSNNRKVDFRNEDKECADACSRQKYDDNGPRHENARRIVRRKMLRSNDSMAGFRCNDVSYLTDRGGEADDENSQHGKRPIARHDLDEEPQKECHPYEGSSNESILDYCYDDLYTEPMLKNRMKPALLRAVNWIFGGCPASSRGSTAKEVGKEENLGHADEWLL